MIISTTITNNREALIGTALASIAPHVDMCLVIDTGCTDHTIENARRVVLAAGKKFAVATFAWCDDFAAARQFALDTAAEMGGTWAFAVDTDETIEFAKFMNDPSWQLDLRAFLESTEADVLFLEHETHTFKQTRVFRLPNAGKWHGRVHEGFPYPKDKIATLPHAFFRCTARPDEDLTAKFSYYRKLLELSVVEEPACQRWWYYLGDTCAILEDKRAALDAWMKCANLNDWADQGAWACYRAGLMLVNDAPGDAMQWIIKGLMHKPKSPELHWLGGFLSLNVGDYENAINFSNFSVKCGMFRGLKETRVGFSNPAAQWELPFQTLFAVYLTQKDEAKAAEAANDFIAAQQARMAYYKGL